MARRPVLRLAARPAPATPLARLITIPQAARACGVSTSTFRRWLQGGAVPSGLLLEVPGRVLVRVGALERWLNGQDEPRNREGQSA